MGNDYGCVLLQSKALIPLQSEANPETNQRVLTNYMFPQQPRHEDGRLWSCGGSGGGDLRESVSRPLWFCEQNSPGNLMLVENGEKRRFWKHILFHISVDLV